MKKIFLFLASCLFAFGVQANSVSESKFIKVEGTQRAAQPEVIEFFSFYCPHCYSFEYDYDIPKQVKADLPAGTEFKQYHVNFLARESENLTRAWAFAMATGVENQVKRPLFEAAQKNSLKSMQDIRQIFIDNGIKAEDFDNGINSFAVTALVNKQVNAAEQFKVRGVPDFYINNLYRVNVEGLAQDSKQAFVQDYLQTIKGLLQK